MCSEVQIDLDSHNTIQHEVERSTDEDRSKAVVSVVLSNNRICARKMMYAISAIPFVMARSSTSDGWGRVNSGGAKWQQA